MSTTTKSASPTPASITKLIGAVAVLPGESAQLYRASLAALVQELQATTVLQVYLAEKIHECLWWVRRYEAQKRATITAQMALIATNGSPIRISDIEAQVLALLNSGNAEDMETLAQMLKGINHTPESLQQKAMANKAQALQQLDQQIALQTKMLAGLQSSYEAAFSRKLAVERLQLQKNLLRRDLQAINIPPADLLPASPEEPNDQPQP